jgi:AcrR family transcriptional regulator
MAEAPSTPQVSRRKRRSPEAIRDLIIAAAGAEFEENGYSGATTAAIARRADVTEAQIFRFFDSKQELFREAIFQPLNAHFSAFHASTMTDAAASDFRGNATRYINELQDFMAEHARSLMSLIVAKEYKGSAEGLSEIDGLRAYFERGAAMSSARIQGQPPVPPELMVRVSFAAVLGSVMFKDWLFPAGMASDEAIRQAIVDFTIDGIRANEG